MCYEVADFQEVTFNGEMGWRQWTTSRAGNLRGLALWLRDSAWESEIGVADKPPNLRGWKCIKTHHGLYFWDAPPKDTDWFSAAGRCALYGPGYIVRPRGYDCNILLAESAVIEEVAVWGGAFGFVSAQKIRDHYKDAFPVFRVDKAGNVIDECGTPVGDDTVFVSSREEPRC